MYNRLDSYCLLSFFPVRRVGSLLSVRTTSGKPLAFSKSSCAPMSEYSLSKCPVESLYDALVSMRVHSATTHLYIMFYKQLSEDANELATLVYLQQIWPSKRSLPTHSSQSRSDFIEHESWNISRSRQVILPYCLSL